MSNVNLPCGCVDEDVRSTAFSLTNAQPMQPQSAFMDGGWCIRHFCDAHWRERNPASSPHAAKAAP